MVTLRLRYLVMAVAALLVWLPAQAQSHRGIRTTVRGGLFEKPDTLVKKRDSLRMAEIVRGFDSLSRAAYLADSSAVMALRTDDLRTLDSIYNARALATLVPMRDTAARREYKKGWFMSDSMGISKVCWLSAILPGYGQVYNKQYWKLPVLYGTLGAGIALYLHESKVYKPMREQYDEITSKSLVRTPELDELQARMIRSNTKRQLYLGISIASYIYFLGDAAVNYATNNVSHVKKATTLACIFPGAGQIYNKSYWKVPFVIGGFAALIYTIDWNNRGFQRFKKAYGLRSDYDAHPENYPDGPTDEFKGRYSASYLKDLRNNFRRNRDFCIILTAGLYVLQIVDAHVDAHLKDYDISDDLSMHIEPMVNYAFIPAAGGNRPVFGFNLNVKF